MKFLVLSLALLGLAIAQECDITTGWALFQDSGDYVGSEWEEFEIHGWSMDGGNKWFDFWLHDDHLSAATCTDDFFSAPTFDKSCGTCNIVYNCGSRGPPSTCTSFAECYCYPSYGFLGEIDGKLMGDTPDWSDNLNEFPYEPNSEAQEWSVLNCEKNRPERVYYYSQNVAFSDDKLVESWGISKAFRPTVAAWSDFCEAAVDSDKCHVPSPDGSEDFDDLVGADYSYDESLIEYSSEENEATVYPIRKESGCRSQQSGRTYPSFAYCGDDAGWRYGAGTYTHVRFGCDRGTWQDSDDTDEFGDYIDDEDCDSVYVAFDELSPVNDATESSLLELGGPFTSARRQHIRPSPNGLRSQRTAKGSKRVVSSECYQKSGYTKYYSNIKEFSWATPCSASGLAVPFFTLASALLIVVWRNF